MKKTYEGEIGWTSKKPSPSEMLIRRIVGR